MFYTAEVNTDIGHFSVTQVTNSRLSVVNLALQTLETLVYQMKNDPRSCASNICNCIRSLKKKIRTSTGFEQCPRDTGGCSYKLNYKATYAGSWSITFSYIPEKEMNVTNVYEINHI